MTVGIFTITFLSLSVIGCNKESSFKLSTTNFGSFISYLPSLLTTFRPESLMRVAISSRAPVQQLAILPDFVTLSIGPCVSFL